MGRYWSFLRSLGVTVWQRRQEVAASLLVFVGWILATAVAMHFLERGEQPDAFGSIWDSIYWSVITMTTVGYGDLVPVTPAGRALAGISSFIGVAILLLSASILAQAFVQHMDHFGTKCKHCGKDPYGRW